MQMDKVVLQRNAFSVNRCHDQSCEWRNANLIAQFLIVLNFSWTESTSKKAAGWVIPVQF